MNSKYPLHPDFSDVKDSGKGSDSILLLRFANMLIRGMNKKNKADGIKVTEEIRIIPGYKSADIKIRIYSPVGVQNEVPCVVNFHGGAFAGDVLPHQINYSLYFAEHVKCKVVLVEYRLSIDHPFPVGVEDSYAALQWVFAHAEELSIDKNRIAVFGDSSGGNYAASVCHMARDRGGALPCYQMLIYPVTDSRRVTESAKKYLDTPEFNAYANERMWKIYLKNGDFGMPQYAAPLLASDFSNLPDAYIETAEFDPLHDEDILYAQKLRGANVQVELYETKGTYHGFDIKMNRPFSQAALIRRADVLRRVFER